MSSVDIYLKLCESLCPLWQILFCRFFKVHLQNLAHLARQTLDLVLDRSPPSPPDGYSLRAEITLTPSDDGVSLPLALRLETR